jgi:hypothetical protein
MGEPRESKTSKQGTIRGMVIHLSVQSDWLIDCVSMYPSVIFT